MPIRDTWHRTLVYFGLAEDRDAYEEEPEPTMEPEAELEDRYRERPNVRRLRRRRDEIDDIFADDGPSERRPESTSLAAHQVRALFGRAHWLLPSSVWRRLASARILGPAVLASYGFEVDRP